MEISGLKEQHDYLGQRLQQKNKYVDIEESINTNEGCSSVLERYYKPMYCLSINDEPIDHHCLLFHSNRICLLTLAPSHPILKLNKNVEKINCNINGDLDRMKNKVVGKSKRGGQKLLPETILCQIECTDGSLYKIRSCIKGKLIEMNENVISNPCLLLERPNTDGHIAVLLSDLITIEAHKKNMLTIEEYKNVT